MGCELTGISHTLRGIVGTLLLVESREWLVRNEG
jgi:hypothetical protein